MKGFSAGSSTNDCMRWLSPTPVRPAIVAGIQPLTGHALQEAQAGKRPSPRIPKDTLAKILAVSDSAGQRAKAIEIAVETIGQLSKLPGLRGFCIASDGDLEAFLEIIDKSGLRSD